MKTKYTSTEILNLLFEDGWREKNQVGSHIQLIHPTKKGKVTVPAKGKTILPPGTQRRIFQQAGLK